MNPLELLWETPGEEPLDLPDALVDAYGGPLGLGSPTVFVNFVASTDGVVAIPALPNSNRLIAAASESDRFVMGLLRAVADAVVIGSGTMNAAPRSLWTPTQAYPAAAGAFAQARSRLGLSPEPELVILTARGTIDPAHPAFEAGALVVTTDAGATRLRSELPGECTVISAGAGEEVDIRAAFGALAARGHERILSEGGPRVLGSLLGARAVDELFLTLSPVLVGRTPLEQRLSLVEDADLLTDGPLAARLLGVRRDESHLFLRYAL